MYNGNKIKELLVKQHKTNKELLNYLGVGYNSSLTQLTSGNPTVKKLEQIADFFEVPTDVFFTRAIKFEESNDSTNDVNLLKQKIIYLQNLLDEKDKNIKLLEQLNALLAGTLSGQKK